VVLREDVTEEQLIDYISGNKIYVPALAAINKIDLIDEREVDELLYKLDARGLKVIPISAEENIAIEHLKSSIFSKLDLIRIYLRPRAQAEDVRATGEPLIVRKGATVGTVCSTLHRDFLDKFKYAMVWGKSSKFPGQMVGLNHVLMDKDIVTIVVAR
jgi:hypothetical protein